MEFTEISYLCVTERHYRRSEEQAERARENEEVYRIVIDHLEKHPYWDKMYDKGDKKEDDDDEEDLLM